MGRATGGGFRRRFGREAGLSERDCPYRLFGFVLYFRYSELFIYGVSFFYEVLILEITESSHLVSEPFFCMAKHTVEVVEKLTTQVEELKSKIMQIDELKVAHASTQATLEQMQVSTQGMFQQMLLQMQSLTSTVSTKLGKVPISEVSGEEKQTVDSILPPIATTSSAIKEKKGELFPFYGENPETWL